MRPTWTFETGDAPVVPEDAHPKSVFFVRLWHRGTLAAENGYVAPLTDAELRCAKWIAYQQVRADLDADLRELEEMTRPPVSVPDRTPTRQETP